MAKRHPSLVPVARDHLQSLVVAANLLRTSHGAADRWPADPAAQAERLRAFHDEHLRSHFAVEEALVFPFARAHVPDGATLVGRLVDEHRELERRIGALGGDGAGGGRSGDGTGATGAAVDPADLVALGALLKAHVRAEDRTLFPLIESHAPEAALAELRREIEARYG